MIYRDRKYAVAFNSGTSALHAILLAYDIGEGDEIIVPSFTFIATANCALFVRAKPVFAEIEEKTCGLNPDDVKERISSKTKAIIPNNIYKKPCLTSSFVLLTIPNNITIAIKLIMKLNMLNNPPSATIELTLLMLRSYR